MSRETRAAYWQGYADALKAADRKLQDFTDRDYTITLARRAIRDLIDDARGPR